jgi:hypothetical protein
MTRHFHSSISARNAHQGQQPEETKEDDFEELENFDEEDLVATFTDAESASESTAAGHLKMRHERHLLHYLRLIEEKVPYLVGMLPFTASACFTDFDPPLQNFEYPSLLPHQLLRSSFARWTMQARSILLQSSAPWSFP